MIELFALSASRLSIRLAAVILCAIAIVAAVSPASARPSHRGHSIHHIAGHHHGRARHIAYRHHRFHRHDSSRRARIAVAVPAPFAANAMFMPPAMQTPVAQRRVSRRYARRVVQTMQPAQNFSGGFGGSSLVAEARRYIGGNPTGRSRLWCARFMNMVLQRSGHRGTGSDLARSFASYGRRVPGPQVGAIAVMGRRGGGHVGVVSGIDARGNPIIVSGNHNHRVAEATYPRGRIYAYVVPTS